MRYSPGVSGAWKRTWLRRDEADAGGRFGDELGVDDHRRVVGVVVVVQHIHGRDVAGPHGDGVVDRDRRLVLGQRWARARPSRRLWRTLIAVGDGVGESDLLGEGGGRGDADERGLEQLDDQPLRR